MLRGGLMAYDVFVSYSHEDKLTADAVCATLEGQGIRCWIAPRDITPGQEWGQAIIQGISGARIMVVVFSHHSNESQQVMREVERAVHAGIAVLPFRIEDVIPSGSMEYFLSSMHWLDALTDNMEEHIHSLAASIRASLDVDGESPASRPEGVESPPRPQPTPAHAAAASSPSSRNKLFPIAAAIAAVAVLLYFGLFGFQGGDDVSQDGDARPALEAPEPADLGRPETERQSVGDEQPVGVPTGTSPSADEDVLAEPLSADLEQAPESSMPVSDPVAAPMPVPVQAPVQAPIARAVQPEAADPVKTFAAPPANAVVAETPGDYEYAYLVHAEVEGELVDQDFAVIDLASAPNGSIREAARFRVVTTARVVDTRELQYFGRVQTHYTVSLTLRVTDLSNGAMVVGPVNSTVQYTSINVQENLQQAARELARRAAEDLRRLIA